MSAWTPKYKFDSAPQVSVWVRFPKLPIHYWGNASLSKIASQIEAPVEMDSLTKSKDQPNFARVKVRMRITTCLQDTVKYADEEDWIIEHKVEYEWKPVLCTHCNMFGHNVAVCRKAKEPKQQWVPKSRQEWVPKQNNDTNDEWHMVTRKKNKGKETVKVIEVVDKDTEERNTTNSHAGPFSETGSLEAGNNTVPNVDEQRRVEETG